MEKELTEEHKLLLEQVVRECVSTFEHNPAGLRTLHIDYITPYSTFIVGHVNMTRRLRETLEPTGYGGLTSADRRNVIDETLKRLHSKGLVRKAKLSVPLSFPSDETPRGRKIELRDMRAYVTSTALDRLADV